MKISVVSPVYKSEDIIDELISQLIAAISQITLDFEVILVDDCSPDNSWKKIQEYKEDKNIKAIKLSKNFGQHHAISAGLRFAKGQWIVVMDCDLQDPPAAINELYQKAISDNFMIVQAKRTHREDNIFRVFASAVNHKIFSFFSGIKTDPSLSHFGIYHKKVVQSFNQMNEQARNFTLLIHSLGFTRANIEINKSSRFSGKSSYSFIKLLNHGINTIVSHSNKPLILSINLGFIISFFSFAIAVYNVVAKLTGLIGVEGFTSTIFSIWFSTGIILTFLGVLGLYLGKIYDEVKMRPLFVVEDLQNIDSKT